MSYRRVRNYAIFPLNIHHENQQNPSKFRTKTAFYKALDSRLPIFQDEETIWSFLRRTRKMKIYRYIRRIFWWGFLKIFVSNIEFAFGHRQQATVNQFLEVRRRNFSPSKFQNIHWEWAKLTDKAGNSIKNLLITIGFDRTWFLEPHWSSLQITHL